MTSCLLVVLGFGLTVGAEPTKEDKFKDELKKLEGTWVVRSSLMNGKNKDDDRGVEFQFAGDTGSFRRTGRTEKFTYKIDPTQKPFAIDLEADNRFVVPMKAIYEFDGDDLRICRSVARDNRDKRPTEFTDKGQSILTLRRKKDIA